MTHLHLFSFLQNRLMKNYTFLCGAKNEKPSADCEIKRSIVNYLLQSTKLIDKQ